MDYIIYSDGSFEISVNGSKHLSECKIIRHYKDTCEQLRRSHEWKGATDRVFSESYLIQTDDPYFAPRMHGIASGSECFYYALELENGGGIYKKSKSASGDEGFVYTSNTSIPQHLNIDGNRLVCSLQFPDLTKHIAMFISERPDYYQLTDGESVDEHPFVYGENIYFTTSGIHRDENGGTTIANKGIARFDIAHNSVTELLTSEKYEYLIPKIDAIGDLYCIRRPTKNTSANGSLIIDIITAPFWIFMGIISFILTFTRIFTGKQLMGKNVGSAAAGSAKEIIDGCEIDIAREEKRNKRSGELNYSYAPRNWELIKLGNASSITPETSAAALRDAKVLCHGVIGYELLDDGTFVTSNGNYLIHHLSGGASEVIAKAHGIDRNFTVLNV